MISGSDEFTRRVLTLPAVRPCESVSPACLLASLINLARSICNYKSKNFFINKRNCKELIRLIGNLVVFLEEIRNGSSKFSGSTVLSLSELHFTFQKIQFLLEDCTRDDSRIWMLAKCEKVSNQFRVLTRAVAVVLDVLAAEPIGASAEIGELIEFIRRQALKTKFDVEFSDARASMQVFSILTHFEDGIIPEASDAKRVLEYLGIRRWSECNREVKFLDSEIELEGLTVEKKDLGLLNSLMGLMIYSRCTMFDAIDSGRTQQTESSCNNIEVSFLMNPDDFRCPISLEIMTDPVTVATGHTYDRSSIFKWFRAGNFTCPNTGQKLICRDIIPNLALKRLIKQYCSENGVSVADCGARKRDITRTVIAGSVAAKKAMEMVANFLTSRLFVDSSSDQNKAAYEIRLLSKTSIFNRSCLVEAGVIPPLLSLLCSIDSLTQENSAAALLNLSKHSKSKKEIVENGGLFLIIDVLKKGLKMETKQHAAGIIFYLASVEEYRIKFGEIPEAFPSLMELLRIGNDRGKKNALVAIFGLLMHPDHHRRVLEAGLVPFLVNDFLTSSEREGLVTDSLAVLAALAEKHGGAVAVLLAGALPKIVGILSSFTSMAAKEFCVSLLLSLSVNVGKDVVPLLVQDHSLMGPLYSLLTDGTSRAAKKATSLIRILHEFNDKISSSGFLPSAHPPDQSVHIW